MTGAGFGSSVKRPSECGEKIPETIHSDQITCAFVDGITIGGRIDTAVGARETGHTSGTDHTRLLRGRSDGKRRQGEAPELARISCDVYRVRGDENGTAIQ